MTYLQAYCQEIEHIAKQNAPVLYAWERACDILMVGKQSPWREWGVLFSHHPDLIYSQNDYHNHYHSAETIMAAAFLAKYEKLDEKNAMTLCFAMMCHDISHNADHNHTPYELEKKALNSVLAYWNRHEILQNFWLNHLYLLMGSFSEFFSHIECIVLGTDFALGPVANLVRYQSQSDSIMMGEKSPVEILKLPLLANEADVLSSITKDLGKERGMRLAKEQNNPAIATPSSRLKFLKSVIYRSKAAQIMEINEHIKQQIEELEKQVKKQNR